MHVSYYSSHEGKYHNLGGSDGGDTIRPGTPITSSGYQEMRPLLAKLN